MTFDSKNHCIGVILSFFSLLIIIILTILNLYAQQNSDEEVIKQLQRQISPYNEEFIFYLKNGEKIKGVKQEEGQDYIKIKQFFGYSGSLTTKVLKADILNIGPVKKEDLNITKEEIRIKKELPNFNFSHNGAYSFFTDQDYFKITKSIELLQRLYSGFLSTFCPLMDKALNRRIYVIIFSTPAQYYDYIHKAAPYLKNAAGFYDFRNNQLVFYDFFNSQDYGMVDSFVKGENEKLRKLKEENRRYINTDPETYQINLKRIQAYEQSLSAYLSRVALQIKDANIRVLRHESSHQFTFDLIVSSGADNFDTWLLEGLAEFCSTPSIGENDKEHIKTFQEAIKTNSQIPLKELISYSMNNKFYMLDENRLTLAYAQSWALFYFLMQPDWRERFFQYVLNLKTVKRCLNLDERIKFIEDNLDISLDELQKRLIAFAKSN